MPESLNIFDSSFNVVNMNNITDKFGGFPEDKKNVTYILKSQSMKKLFSIMK